MASKVMAHGISIGPFRDSIAISRSDAGRDCSGQRELAGRLFGAARISRPAPCSQTQLPGRSLPASSSLVSTASTRAGPTPISTTSHTFSKWWDNFQLPRLVTIWPLLDTWQNSALQWTSLWYFQKNLHQSSVVDELGDDEAYLQTSDPTHLVLCRWHAAKTTLVVTGVACPKGSGKQLLHRHVFEFLCKGGHDIFHCFNGIFNDTYLPMGFCRNGGE